MTRFTYQRMRATTRYCSQSREYTLLSTTLTGLNMLLVICIFRLQMLLQLLLLSSCYLLQAKLVY